MVRSKSFERHGERGAAPRADARAAPGAILEQVEYDAADAPIANRAAPDGGLRNAPFAGSPARPAGGTEPVFANRL